jgi:hypothetical protein
MRERDEVKMAYPARESLNDEIRGIYTPQRFDSCREQNLADSDIMHAMITFPNDCRRKGNKIAMFHEKQARF